MDVIKLSKKITIIGGAGFIGTNLCCALKLSGREFEIIDLVVSKKFPLETKLGDVRDLQSLRKTITGDIIINLAAVHRDDVSDLNEYRNTNVEGAKNIATICLEKNIRKIIFTSSVAVYGFAKPCTVETGEINPFNEYGKSKYEAEKVLINWQSKNKNNLIIVRPTVVFGEKNRGNVYNLMNQIVSNRFIMVGKGQNKKSMAYVDNLAAFLIFCIDKTKKYALYNYADTPDLTMDELVAIIRTEIFLNKRSILRIPYWFGLLLGFCGDICAQISQKKLPISAIRVRKFCATTQFASHETERLSFKPPYSLKAGLIKTIQYEFSDKI